MTVASFADLNPDWQIIVHYPEEPHEGITWSSREHRSTAKSEIDYFALLSEIDGCEIKEFDFAGIEPRARLPEVIRSDLARWHLLAHDGGWWSDCDILFVRSMSTLDISDKVHVVSVSQMNRAGNNLSSIGFLGSDTSDYATGFFKDVLQVAQAGCNPLQYQSAGTIAFEPVMQAWLGKLPLHSIRVLPPSVVYPAQSWEAKRLYGGSPPPLGPDAIGIHWFGGFGQSQHFEQQATKENVSQLRGWMGIQLQTRLSEMNK
jgi:hypothetical protein